MERKISYAAAIGEAQAQAMDRHESVFICGLETDGERGIFGGGEMGINTFEKSRF